ncbi:MAG TPA: hypothetical protein VJS65_12035 [Verrucomicrobiae bacterium]|nr:hypothetical protein [Verrucomicrobiae bacterium]
MKIQIALAASVVLAGTVLSRSQSIELVGITNSLWSYSIDNSDQYALGFPNVDDSTWPVGRAIFGNDVGYPYPNLVTVPGPTEGVQTSYYRTRFNWPGATEGVVLIMTNYIDDGLLLYLNGTKILNWNVNGEPAHTTLAAAPNPGGEPVRVVHQLVLNALTNGNVNPLVPGQNTLAVSVHQNSSSSSDSVFAMSVHVSAVTPPCAAGISPASTNVMQCHNVTLALNLPVDCGVPAPVIEWFHDGAPIPGATAATLTLTNVQPDRHSGHYYALLHNGVGSVQSAQATVNVTADTQGPRIAFVTAFSYPDNRWLVTFDEPVLPGGGADDPNTYTIHSTGSPSRSFTVVSAVIQASSNQVVLLTDQTRSVLETYVYSTLGNIAGVCAGNTTPPGLTGPVFLQDGILDYADAHIWRYHDGSVDHGIAWRAPSFDDSSWKTGRQMFDRQRGNLTRAVVAGQDVRTFLELTNYAVSPPTNLTTVYFRLKQFIPVGTWRLTAFPIYDDGFILYVNGTEIYRTNVVATADEFANYGGAAVFTAGDPNYVAPFDIPLSVIMTGAENMFAVMLKQSDATSSDMTFGLRLVQNLTGPHFEGPSIIQQPAPISVSEGHVATLRVFAAGTSLDYQWFKDGVAIDGATSATYSKPGVSAADAGNYRVDVRNLVATVSSATVTVTVRPVLAPYGLTWKYATNSQDALLAATPWHATGFDDTSWPSGPGPFGIETTAGTLARLPTPIATVLPAPNSNFLTAYFRTTVTVPAVNAGSTLVLTHLVDDGAIFYVDGVRTLNYNGPTTNPTLSTDLAPGTVPGDGDAMLVSMPIALSAGSHSLAVEVHQNTASSSDVVFGAELRTLSGAGPSLAIAHPTPTKVDVTWTPHPLYSLYQGTNVGGPFLPVGGNPQGTYTLSNIIADTARYFQLRYNGR